MNFEIIERPAERGRCRRAWMVKIDGEWLLHRGTYIIEFRTRESAEASAKAIIVRRSQTPLRQNCSEAK